MNREPRTTQRGDARRVNRPTTTDDVAQSITRRASRITHHASRFTFYAQLLAIIALGLGLRLLVWRWHEPYPLGGDEQEYFDQALTLLREHRYVELRLMRPPLYTGFLAACMYLFDSLVQRIRLIQALISALTVVPIYLLAQRLSGDRRVALVAALLVALNYTLAANATELLTETLFLFGLATLLWLLLIPGRPTTNDQRPTIRKGLRAHHLVTLSSCHLVAMVAGLTLGALALLRSVALPLLPLGALWLLTRTANSQQPTKRSISWQAALCSLFFVLCSFLVIAPWTIRNQLTYGAPILIDTTGPENLWLDNDPAGREAVKRQLYALGEDRGARQRLALNRGVAAIAAAPQQFIVKAWGEAQKFFALQYFDDLRDRRAIWVPPLEVWMRLLLGDGLWLVILLGGTIGLWLARTTADHRPTTESRNSLAVVGGRRSVVSNPRWLFVPWALYTLLTALIFHVELRYRLPLYPVLIPYAAWALVRGGQHVMRSVTRRQGTGDRQQLFPVIHFSSFVSRPRVSSSHVGAAVTCFVLIGLTLLHRPYVGEAWTLAWKHARLWQVERALTSGDTNSAATASGQALRLDPDSALARVALARSALQDSDRAAALKLLDDAIAVLPAHPHAHLLRGALLREQGDLTAAQAEFVYETASLEDLQRWSWQTFESVMPVAAAVEIGGGLDLGYVRGFWSPESAGGFRWSRRESEVRLAVPHSAPARLDLRLAAGRPAGTPHVVVLIAGRTIGSVDPAPGWRTYSLPIPPELVPASGPLVLMIRSDTFHPRDFDRASPDARALGVMVGRVEIKTP